MRVNVTPEVSFTEDGKRETLRDLHRDGTLDRQTVLEAYRIGNVQEVIERVITEEAEKAKQQQPVEADKLPNALANLMKAGEPVTIEQAGPAAMEQAGLPSVEIAPDAAAIHPQIPVDTAA